MSEKSKEKPRRKRMTRGERRLEIRRAAYRCFSQSGYHRTTVDDVCESAGISKGTFYWYFESKQAVFVDIIDAWADEVQVEMRAQFAAAMASESAWQTITLAVEREAERSKSVVPVWLEFLTEAAREEYARVALDQFHKRLRRVLRELLELALPDFVSPEQTESLASSALAMFFGLLCQELVDPAGASFSVNARAVMSVLERVTDPDADPTSEPAEPPANAEEGKNDA